MSKSMGGGMQIWYTSFFFFFFCLGRQWEGDRAYLFFCSIGVRSRNGIFLRV